MDDDLSRLRETMSGLAEHGGSTDLYRGALDRSRRLGRRRTAGWASAVAVTALLIGLPVALGMDRQAGLPPASAVSATAAVPPTVTVPSSAPVTPETVRPRRTGLPAATSAPSVPRRTPAVRSGAPRSGAEGCPVDAATLQRASGLPEGERVTAATVECREGWAAAGMTVASERRGDGRLFFEYDPATGRWHYRGRGALVPCDDPIGIPASTGFCRQS